MIKSVQAIIAAVTLLGTTELQAQNYEWATITGGSSMDYGNSLITDKEGNTYSCGHFYGTMTFDPSSGVSDLVSVGKSDIFVCKYDVNGNIIWAKSAGDTYNDHAYGIGVDREGNVYIAGKFYGIVDFDPSENQLNLMSTKKSSGSITYDAFVWKLNQEGDFVWAKSFGGQSYDEIFDIVVNDDGDIFSTGYFAKSIEIDLTNSTTTLVSKGSEDVFVTKMNTNGEMQWAKNYGGTKKERGNAIAIDDQGNILVTGYFEESIDFDPSMNLAKISSQGEDDLFILKLNPSGEYIWANSIGGSSNDEGESVAIDDEGNVYVTGFIQSTANLNPNGTAQYATSKGYHDVVIAKYNSDGDYQWGTTIGSEEYDIGSSIAVDNLGSVFIGGGFYRTIDCDPSQDIAELTADGLSLDAFIITLSEEGEFMASFKIKGNSSENIRDLAIDSDKNLMVLGSCYSYLNPNPANPGMQKQGNGSSNFFISKYSQNTVGINERISNNHESLTIYPNPAHETLHIEGAKLNIQIMDMSGKLVYSGTDNMIDVSGFNSGIYFVKTPNSAAAKLLIK